MASRSCYIKIFQVCVVLSLTIVTALYHSFNIFVKYTIFNKNTEIIILQHLEMSG